MLTWPASPTRDSGQSSPLHRDPVCLVFWNGTPPAHALSPSPTLFFTVNWHHSSLLVHCYLLADRNFACLVHVCECLVCEYCLAQSGCSINTRQWLARRPKRKRKLVPLGERNKPRKGSSLWRDNNPDANVLQPRTSMHRQLLGNAQRRPKTGQLGQKENRMGAGVRRESWELRKAEPARSKQTTLGGRQVNLGPN